MNPPITTPPEPATAPTQDNTRRSRLQRLLVSGWLLLMVLHWFIGLWPKLSTFQLAGFPDRIVIAAPAGALVMAWLGGGLLLAFGSLVLMLRRRAARQPPTPWERAQARLTLLPLLVLLTRALQGPFPVLSGNLLFFGAPAVLAWALAGGYAPVPVATPRDKATRREWVLIALGFAVIYWLTGWYFTVSVGEHCGDEAHYLIQAESLCRDHDLDIRNQLGNPTNAVSLFYMHIGTNSRDGHWYSLHTPGLAFLLAPTVPYGWSARHLVLGLISGLGLAGFFALCRRLSRDRITPWILLLLLGASTLWGVYSCRALPEILGASLTVCGVLAILNREERPRASLLLLLLLTTALPFAYVRFLPIALTLGGCYGLFELLSKQPWRAKIFRLALLVLGGACGLGAFFAFQAHLFGWQRELGHTGYSFEFTPLYTWHSLASGRGILVSLPLFACALPACLTLLFQRQLWRAGLTCTLVLLSILMTWASCNLFQGGSTLPGRMLLVTVPVVIATLAAALPTANRAFRGLAFFLGLLSITTFLSQLSVLPDLHNEFRWPCQLDIVHPLFFRLLRCFYDPYETIVWLPGLALYGGALLLLLRPTWPRWVQAGTLLLIAALWGSVSELGPTRTPLYSGDGTFAKDTSHTRWWVYGNTRLPAPLWPGLLPRRIALPAVVLRDPPPARADDIIRYGDIGDNDWDHRGYRWATLDCPKPGGRGWRVLSLAAQLEGEVGAEFVIREGTHTLVSKTYAPHTTIRDVFTFETHHDGDLYFLVRLEGNAGAFQKGLIAISPFDPVLLKKANLTLPTPAEIPVTAIAH